MRTHACAVVAATLIVAVTNPRPSQAQTKATPAPSVVHTLLESPTLQDQAWGAWWVATGRLDQFDGELRANLEAALDPMRAAADPYHNQFVLDATLDALIRLGRNVLPPDLLAAVYKQRSEAAVALAAKSSLPKESIDPFLRSVVDDDQASWLHVAWLGAVDLLIAHHAPGTFAMVLRDMTLTAHAVLCDASIAAAPFETTGAALGNQDCGRVAMGYGGSWPSSIPDPSYPPWIHYDLVLPSRSEPAMAQARQAMSVQYPTLASIESAAPEAMTFVQGGADATSLSGIRYAGTSRPPSHGPVTVADRLAIVASVVPKKTPPMIEGAVLVVPWHDDASAQAAIAAFERSLRERYEAMIADLRAVDALSADDAAAFVVPAIRLVTDDRRK